MTAERGQILPLFALMLALLLLPVTGLAVDGGILIAKHAALVGAAEDAAEAGSQAVDVSALDGGSNFQLCDAEQPGSTCGNGVGSVQAVVSKAVQVSLGRGQSCVPAAASQTFGCWFRLLPRCGRESQGVQVTVAAPVTLPLLSFGPWSHATIRASATSWMQHGYAVPLDPREAGC